MEDIKTKLKQDEAFKRYVRVRKNISESFPVESLQEELFNIHSSRKVRTVTYKGVSAQTLLNMSMDEVNRRARLTEILVQANRQYNSLNTVLEAITSHIKSEYADDLKTFRSQADRTAAVASLLSSGWKTLESIGAVIEEAELIIKDIDQSSFTLNRVANLIELATRREHIATANI